ncbi:hypothetical protein PInf_001524 [Phytophthora infestans]|nr:hypothetical protein PInf_001524 [Phytophthora infestans]
MSSASAASSASQALENDVAPNSPISTRGSESKSDGSMPTVRYNANHQDDQLGHQVSRKWCLRAKDVAVATRIKSAGAYLYSDLKYIGLGYKYDRNKLYKHYWVLDTANVDGKVCAERS